MSIGDGAINGLKEYFKISPAGRFAIFSRSLGDCLTENREMLKIQRC